MSVYPCDACGHRVPGQLGAAYIGLLDSGVRYGRKLRLCDPHLDSVLGGNSPRLQLVDADDQLLDPDLCATCDDRRGDGVRYSSLFITAFRRGDERHDYFAALCPGCSEAYRVMQQLSL